MPSDEPIACTPEFRIIAESSEWIVVSKAAPLIVHPSNGKKEPNLLQGVEALLCYEVANGMKTALINRLDRETSGLTLIAKTPTATRQLGRAMQRRQMHKEYSAIVYGHPDWEKAVCNESILRQGDVMESRIWLKQCIHPQGRKCRTDFTVLRHFNKSGNPYSLVRCVPETGRMHQIRVHLAFLGYPIVGDKIYGPSEECYLDFVQNGWTPSLEEQLILERHALHACILDFPFDEEIIHTQDTLSPDLANFIAGADGKNPDEKSTGQ